MEKSRNTSLDFKVKKLDINSEDYWDEIIQITFISGEDYIAISRLSYEDEVYIEFNDQINFIHSHYKDIAFNLDKKNILSIVVFDSMKRSVNINNINIYLNNCDFLQIVKAIEYLKKDV